MRRGSGGSGGILRSVGRTTRAGAASDSFAAASNPIRSSRSAKFTSPSNIISLSSTPSYEASLSIAPASSSTPPTWPPPVYRIDDWDWVSVDAANVKNEDCDLDDCVFGRVPCADEVQSALNSLQKVLDLSEKESTNTDSANNSEKDMNEIPAPSEHSVSSVGSVSDWKEPSPNTMLQTHPSQQVYDALYLLKTEPSVQRMVISLSSDKAVWEAVLNNEAVQNLRESYFAAEMKGLEISSSGENPTNVKPAIQILGWLFDGTKENLGVLFEKITMLLNPLFKWKEDEQKKKERIDGDLFSEMLNSSLLICVLVLFLVAVTRATGA